MEVVRSSIFLCIVCSERPQAAKENFILCKLSMMTHT